MCQRSSSTRRHVASRNLSGCGLFPDPDRSRMVTPGRSRRPGLNYHEKERSHGINRCLAWSRLQRL